MVDVTSRIIGAESGGNPFAQNPRSSAGGAGQFINSTWIQTLKKHRPDLVAGKSDADLLRLKFDPTLSREMTSAYAADNQNFLRSRGIDPSPGNTYLSHFAGPAGAAALHANPQATVEATLGPRVIAANPFLRGKTGADVINWAAGKMDPAKAMAANLRQRFGAKTEGGVMPQAQPTADGAGIDRLKSALTKSYDPDRLTAAETLASSGQKIAGSSGNALGAIGGSILAGIGGYQRNQERDARKAHDAEFSRLAGDASSTEGLMNVMLGSSDPKMREAGLELKAKLLTPKSEEWVSAGDGFVMNKTTGETRAIPGFQKTTQPTELERRALAGGLKPGTPEYESYVLGGPPKSKTEKWNEGQSKAANFGNMMTQAEGLIGNMGPKDASGKPMLGPDGQPVPAENPKGIGGVLRDALVPFEGLRNTWTPADQQTYNQAAEQWIRAKLRKESGAAIGDEEMAKEFKTYFPQYGDGPDVIRQKADARAEATRGMIAESAGAYQHFFGGEKGAAETGGDPDAPRSVRTQTIDPTTGQPRQGGSAAPAPQQTVAPPAGAVTKLLQNPTPEMQTFFDQKYGEGAAARIMEAQKTRPAAAPTPDPLQQQPNSIGAF